VADEYWTKQLEAEKRFPPVSIVRYEVIELPLFVADPHVGQVRVAFGDGTHVSSIRAEVDGLLVHWEKIADQI
jgi:hypothetical protein